MEKKVGPCWSCRFGWRRSENFLQCVRNAPRPVQYNGDGLPPDDLGQAWAFPRVYENYRCGEYQRPTGANREGVSK